MSCHIYVAAPLPLFVRAVSGKLPCDAMWPSDGDKGVGFTTVRYALVGVPGHEIPW